jgi:DNA-binding HxlR family transcriptional regulator
VTPKQRYQTSGVQLLAGPPLAVSYALTERGRALMPALEEISRWAQEHLPLDAS